MQLQLDLVVAGLLDQALWKHNNALIQLWATGLGDGVDNVFCFNGTEELTGFGGLNLYLDIRQLLELVADLTCVIQVANCLLYTSPSPRDRQKSRMPSSA